LETHQKLTIIGIVLLVMTLLINYYQPQQVHSDIEFNYVYISGVAMLAVFLASYIMFTKDRLKES